MLTFATRPIFRDKEHKQSVVQVQSSLCFYHVAITSTNVVLTGPGVEEEYEREQFPPNLSIEGIAIIAVVFFEEDQT